MKKGMTQHELVLTYLESHKFITPARMGGTPYLDGFFGSETTARCRELRAQGLLGSFRETAPDGTQSKFVSFFLITK